MKNTFCKILAVMGFTGTCYAQNLVVQNFVAKYLLRAEDIPIAKSLTADPKKVEIFVKIQQAAMVQSGFAENYNKGIDIINGKISKETKRGVKYTSQIVDEHTFLNSRYLIIFFSTAYAVTKNKEYTFSFKDPIVSGLNHSLTMRENGGETGLSMSF